MSANTLLKAIWERNRAMLLTVVALAGLSLVLLLYQQLVVDSRLLELRLQQAQLQQQIRQQQTSRAGHGEQLSEAQLIAADLQQFLGLIPDKKQFSAFIGELFSWAQVCRLEIRQINYAPEIDKESGLLRYGLSFSLSGEYVQLKRFIHLLENSPRLLVVERIALAGSESSAAEKPGVQLQIQLTTYFQEGGQ